MQLFIDSSNPSEIRTAAGWGIIDGVTTNPTLIAKAGPDMQAALDAVIEASPGPVLCQAVGSTDAASLVEQARWLHSHSDKIIVKLPMSHSGLEALRTLKGEVPEARLAVTLVSSVAQAYLVGKLGADIVAIFNGPLDQELDQEVELVAPVRTMYDNYGFTTKILSCGRFPRAFGRFAVAGTDICTMRFEYLQKLYEHPYTDKRMRGFMQDWEKIYGEATWPRLGA